MPDKQEGNRDRLCGAQCPRHQDAVCGVGYRNPAMWANGSPATSPEDEFARTYAREGRASRRLPGGGLFVLTDASQPHPHHHWDVLNDGTLLTHRWGGPDWPEGWTVRRPANRATKLEREREQLAAWKRWRFEGTTSYPPDPGLVSPEEWERLRREIGVKSTRPGDHWKRLKWIGFD